MEAEQKKNKSCSTFLQSPCVNKRNGSLIAQVKF